MKASNNATRPGVLKFSCSMLLAGLLLLLISAPLVEHWRYGDLLDSVLVTLMLLAATNHVCQDVAVVPLLWVMPLALYLLSFIICFDHPRWYIRWLWAAGAAVELVGVAAVELQPATNSASAKAPATRGTRWNIDWILLRC